MLDIAPTRVALVGCFSTADVLDELPPLPALSCRVARDEVLLVSPPAVLSEVLEKASAHVSSADGVVVDLTDAWCVYELAGREAAEGFRRLVSIPLPTLRPVFLQCAVAHVPGKVVAQTDRLHVMVPSPFAHHLRARILVACADLSPTEGYPRPFTLEVEAAAQ